MVQTGSRINVSSVGHAGYNAANEKHWVGRPFWERDGGAYATSHTLDVFDAPMTIKVFGLPNCEAKVVVQMVAGCNEGTIYEDLWIHCKPVVLHKQNNLVVIPVDGRYRLRLFGCEPDEITVVQHRTGIIFDFGSLLT